MSHTHNPANNELDERELEKLAMAVYDLYTKDAGAIAKEGSWVLLKNQSFMDAVAAFVGVPRVSVGWNSEDREACVAMQRLLMKAQELCQQDPHTAEFARLFHAMRNEVVRSNYKVMSDHVPLHSKLSSMRCVSLNTLATSLATGEENPSEHEHPHQNLSALSPGTPQLAEGRAAALCKMYGECDVLLLQEADPELARALKAIGFDVVFHPNTQLPACHASSEFVSAEGRGTHEYGQIVAVRKGSGARLRGVAACTHAGSGSITQFGTLHVDDEEPVVFLNVHWTLFQDVGDDPAEYARALYDFVCSHCQAVGGGGRVLIVGDSNATMDVEVPALNSAYRALEELASLCGCRLVPSAGLFTTFSYGMRGLTFDHVFASQNCVVLDDAARQAVESSPVDFERMIQYAELTGVGLLAAGRKHTVCGHPAHTTYLLMYYIACDYAYGRELARERNKTGRVLVL
jgi:hypothetical protein